MPPSQPIDIDYARAESVDVVRKKFRRRVVMFVIATAVLIVIRFGWWHSPQSSTWQTNLPFGYQVYARNDWVGLLGPERKKFLAVKWKNYQRSIGNDEVGIVVSQINVVGWQKWDVYIRYRTLFILAMIPWIITLIRLIRVWKRRPGL